MNPSDRWVQTWRLAGRSAPSGLWSRLAAAHGESHRAYHTLRHVSECFEHLDGAVVPVDRPAELELALWFHDAVYDPRAGDNEERSADWARAALAEAGTESGVLDRVEALILVTKHDRSPADGDQRLLLDLDLSILGAPRDRFDEYERQIRREYARVPEETYREARSRILRGFLDRRALYRTEFFRERLEERARGNLERSLATGEGRRA